MSRMLGRSYLTPHTQPHTNLFPLFGAIQVRALTVDRARASDAVTGGSMFLEDERHRVAPPRR